MASVTCLVITLLGLVVAGAPTAAGQLPFAFGVPRADSLLTRGLVARAESAYYAASEAHPRDPVARAALGRFLAARGATQVATVLLEEARTFGGDPARIARDLAPLYDQLGDYAELARLPASPLSQTERDRVAWLAAAGSAARLAEVNTARYRSVDGAGSVGTVAVRVNGEDAFAVLDPNDSRIVVDPHTTTAHRLRIFQGGPSEAELAVADSLSIGGMVFTNVPITVAPLSHGATVSVGLVFLARYAPTFDPVKGSITLRADGTVSREAQEVRVPLLMTTQGLRALVAGRWLLLTAPELSAAWGAHRLTIDMRRGELAISR